VLEVGSGTGSLTMRLAEQAGAVLSIEIDDAFSSMTEEAIQAQRERVSLLHADVLKNKNELNPQLFLSLDNLRRRIGTKQLKLVSNLPYAVATPVITNLLLTDLEIERMVVTVQWEIAERLLAQPRSKEYSSLAVLAQSLADISLVRQLPPSVFWPRPQVGSAIVLIKPNAAKRAHVGNRQRLRHFLRDLYAHRRKNLRGALASMANATWSKAEVDGRLQELGMPGTGRAEELDLEQHLRLCQVFGEKE
jgi:16S rRNA (adenine1518-N6/adenine1519-N6)-dimethyltransferase